MEQVKFNDITRDFLEDFIAKLPKEDKMKIKEFVQNNPRSSSSSMFTLVKSYVYNTYFRTTPTKERKKMTFSDTLAGLLNDDDDDFMEDSDVN